MIKDMRFQIFIAILLCSEIKKPENLTKFMFICNIWAILFIKFKVERTW